MKGLCFAAAIGVSALLFSACTALPERACYFNGSVLESNPNSYLMEVTGVGSSGLNLGTLATVSWEGLDAPDLKTGEFARVEFDGTIWESYPVQIGNVSAIYQTDYTGNVLDAG